ncbi:MAG: 50S ribosomal protein L15 [Myxococcales bacterium]|nr:50S ribosomal protein L15 [Myxococcales bacterium]
MKTSESHHSAPILSRLSPPDGAVRSKRRKGRGPGSGLGKTAGKGQKGQKARSPGNFSKLGFEGGQTPLQRRLPKMGFHNPFSRPFSIVNVEQLASYDGGATVTTQDFLDARLVRSKHLPIKVLGKGNVEKALTVHAHAFSASAKAKIEEAGGKAIVVASKSE